MKAYGEEDARAYLRRALDYHQRKTAETLEGIAARVGFSVEYLSALTREGGPAIGLSQIMPLCEAVPALLPHELLYLRLREQDGQGALSPDDLTAMREEYTTRKTLGALQRGESTSYREWHRRAEFAARRRTDAL